MNTSAQTPFRAANCSGRRTRILRNWAVFDATGTRIATLNSPYAITPAQDNYHAHLFAAAPELLAALQDFVENTSVPEPRCNCHINPPCNDCVEHSHTREMLANAQAAIAKATAPC